jgi:hypothetical protein
MMREFTVKDLEWEELMRFWPKASCDTANDPLWIVAGNKNEFDDFVISKRVRGLHFDYRYVSNVDILRGLSRIRGFYVGTYEKREDWYAIDDCIKIIKSKGG